MFRPNEDDPPLVIDANGMETGQVALERFEAITRWHRQILKDSGAVHLNQLAQGNPGDRRKAAIPFLTEELFRVLVCEGLNHPSCYD